MKTIKQLIEKNIDKDYDESVEKVKEEYSDYPEEKQLLQFAEWMNFNISNDLINQQSKVRKLMNEYTNSLAFESVYFGIIERPKNKKENTFSFILQKEDYQILISFEVEYNVSKSTDGIFKYELDCNEQYFEEQIIKCINHFEEDINSLKRERKIMLDMFSIKIKELFAETKDKISRNSEDEKQRYYTEEEILRELNHKNEVLKNKSNLIENLILKREEVLKIKNKIDLGRGTND